MDCPNPPSIKSARSDESCPWHEPPLFPGHASRGMAQAAKAARPSAGRTEHLDRLSCRATRDGPPSMPSGTTAKTRKSDSAGCPDKHKPTAAQRRNRASRSAHTNAADRTPIPNAATRVPPGRGRKPTATIAAPQLPAWPHAASPAAVHRCSVARKSGPLPHPPRGDVDHHVSYSK